MDKVQRREMSDERFRKHNFLKEWRNWDCSPEEKQVVTPLVFNYWCQVFQ